VEDLMAKHKRNSKKSQRKARLPKSLEQVNLSAAGIDVGAESHWVAVPVDRDEQSVREFGAFTPDLEALADWLEACGIETIVMESTGVYWIPLFELLETRGFDVKLVDPRRLKTVPGRKTDVLDCQWLQKLHTFGLLAAAFRPEDKICTLRSYLRQRAMLVAYASHHIQHMQKALTQMNVKLQHVVSDITGVTGMSIIEAILEGQRDPIALANLRDRRCKNSKETIAKALQGNWRPEHLFELKQAVELFRTYHQKIAACDVEIELCLTQLEDKSGGEILPREPRKRKRRRNDPAFDMREHAFRISGVDLTKIDGLDGHTVLKLLGEIGTDMSRWPSVKHFASWLCLCPGSRQSGNKLGSGKTRVSANRAAAALRLSAQALHHSDSGLGVYFRRMKARLGPPKAITATAHKLARIIYTMLKYRTDYVPMDAEEYEHLYRKRAIEYLKRRAAALGCQVLAPTVPPTDPTPG
jgi:transposase